MIETLLKKIIDEADIDSDTAKRILRMFNRNEPREVIYTEDEDSLGKIYTIECPDCGETLQFERNSQTAAPYLYCYKCGQKLKRKE